jgi:predicted TIM-barrel fold metal-dependent hydrolase
MNDIVPQGAVKSVHVTANWGIPRALEETRWLQSVADKHGFPHGIVAQADLADPDLDVKLKEQNQFPNLRGVRQMLYWTATRCGSRCRGRISAIQPNSAAVLRCWRSTI